MRVISEIIAAVVALALQLSPEEGTVVIKTQDQFDRAIERINKGKEMHLILSHDTFVLKGRVTASAPLSLEGRNSTVIFSADDIDSQNARRRENGFDVYRIDGSITPYALFFDESGKIFNVSETVEDARGVNYSEAGIMEESKMEAGTIVKIPISPKLQHLNNRRFDKAFGYFDCGWQTVNFLLEKSDGEYFYCKTLNNCRTKNYSYDRKSYKKAVRYVLYNVEKNPGAIYYDDNYLYIPKGDKRVYYVNCTEDGSPKPGITVKSDISVKGVRFMGCSGMEVISKTSNVCDIEECTFQNTLGCALKINRKKDKIVKEANVSNCAFLDCSLFSGAVVELASPYDLPNCINFTSCSVTRCSEGRVTYKNSHGGVWVQGNATLTGNEVFNMPRCHFYFNRGVIIARGNVLYNSDSFNSQVDRNLSSDFGLIYCNHIFNDTSEALNNKVHHILIEGNLLYGAQAYGGDARGIFIDDGRGDVECINNVILNTQSYSIDSRDSKVIDASSVRNSYLGNIVSSNYRLAAGPAVKGTDVPSTRRNILLTSKPNKTSNSVVIEKDTLLDIETSSSCEGDKIKVSKEFYKVLKYSPAWKGISGFVKR